MATARLVSAIAGAGAIAAAMLAGAGAQAQRARDGDSYSIMKPEPWLAPKYQSPRGLPQKPNSARTRPLPRSSVGVAPAPPPTILPSGQAVPNLPPANQGPVPGGGIETFGDRAARCAHQYSVYSVPADQQSTYMNSCTGQ